MSLIGQFTLAMALVVAQGLAGAWTWSWLRPRSTVFERVGVGLALGTATSAVVGVALFFIHPRMWLAPVLVVAVVAITVRVRGGQWFPAQRLPIRRSQIAAVAIGAVSGFASLAWAWRSYPLTGSGTSYHGDMLFFQALAQSLADLGPRESILMSGSQLRYHWLTYAWAGQIGELAAPEPFLMLTRVLPITALLGCVLIVTAWTGRIARHPWAPSIAVLLLVVGGYVGASFGTILNFDSPSQQMSTVWLLGLSVIFLAALRAQRLPWLLIVIAFLAAATTAGKVSAGAIMMFGFAAVAIVSTFRKQAWMRRAWGATAVAAGASVAAFLAWVAGGNDSGGLGLGFLDKMATVIGLNPMRGTLGVALGTALLVLAVAARWVGVVWLLKDPALRWRPWVVMVTAMGLAGLLAIVVLGQGINDSWFALSASAPLAVGAAAGVGIALARAGMPGLRPPAPVIVIVAGSLATVVLVLVLWRQPGDATRWLAPLSAVVATGLLGLLAMKRTLPPTTSVLVGITIGLTVIAGVGRVLPLAGPLISTREGTRIPSEFTLVDSFALLDSDTVAPWDQGAREAGRWLRARTSMADLIASNRTRSPLVAALGGRPTYLSGGHYQGPYGPPGAIEEVQLRDGYAHAFVSNPTAETWRPLCEAGVTWLWIDPSLTPVRDWSPYVSIEQSGASVILARASSPC